MWRREFLNDRLAFYVVQLAMHRYLPDEDTMAWPIVRQAQHAVCKKLENAKLVLAVDHSMIKDIHPVMKKEVGERLCDAACGRYKLPECIWHEVSGDKVRLRFTEGPLALLERRPLGMGGKSLSDEELLDVIKVTGVWAAENTRDGEEGAVNAAEKLREYFSAVQCFELACSDEVFYPAVAEIRNGNEIVLCCDMVSEPKVVRYAWRDFAIVTLFTEDGYPVMPFRRELD